MKNTSDINIDGKEYKLNFKLTNGNNPYLSDTSNMGNKYKEGALNALRIMEKSLTRKELSNLVDKKLQTKTKKFNESQFIQSACELTICAYFASLFPENFKYEPKINPPKDIDCSFQSNGYDINVEIKCADFTSKKELDSQPKILKLGSMGRTPGFDEQFKKIEKLIGENSDYSLVMQKHMDNRLKDYLLSAHEKFDNEAVDDTLNVLAVCCDDAADIQKWFGYMSFHEGLFTQNSFFDSSKFNNVDVVLLTNLHHRHSQYIQKNKIFDHWQFSDAFNLIFSNPFRKKNKRDEIFHLLEVIPNFSVELHRFQVKGNIPQKVKDAMRINHFVAEELQQKGRYFFQPIT